MVVWNSHVAANYYHQLGRWWRNMLVSYVYRSNLTVYNLRTKLPHFSFETNGWNFMSLKRKQKYAKLCLNNKFVSKYFVN